MNDAAPRMELEAEGFVLQVARLLAVEGKAPSLAELSRSTGYSTGHIQRAFKQVTGLSPAAFARALREDRAARALLVQQDVTSAIYEAGYESPARFYAAMQKQLGMAPSAWKAGGRGVMIGWQVVESGLGPVLLAATQRGLCRLSFGEGEAELRAHFPNAQLVEGGLPDGLADAVLAQIEAPASDCAIALDIGGTPFQQRVWQALRQIPAGETRSYAEIAAVIGNPKASRAVGGANGANPVAVIIPCHRVIAADGGLGGYAYGEAIKTALLEREGST